MDRYTKGFVVASLLYFFLAALLGIWMGAAATPGWARFAHIHFNLLGFMAMMVYGVGYFILPRFNGRTLRWPTWVPVHFFVANLGLVGMVATYPERPSPAFILFAALSVASAGMFVANLAATLLLAPATEAENEEPAIAAKEAAPAASTSASPASIDPDMRVGEILTRWPATAEVFADNGFPSLADPAHREQVKQIPVTLRMACGRHNVELEPMAAKLAAATGAPETHSVGAPLAFRPVAHPLPGGAAKKGSLGRGERIGADHVLGEILAAYPETEKVFRKYFGGGCFSCPGQATESVKQSALMHNVSEMQLLSDLNRAAGV
jgi:hypothetical protein